MLTLAIVVAVPNVQGLVDADKNLHMQCRESDSQPFLKTCLCWDCKSIFSAI